MRRNITGEPCRMKCAWKCFEGTIPQGRSGFWRWAAEKERMRRFFARNGYQVTAFDVTESGIEKARRLADIHQADIDFFRADLRDFRLDEDFDIIYSSGVFHHILPELRDEIMENYRSHTASGGMHAVNVLWKSPLSRSRRTRTCVPGTGHRGNCSPAIRIG